MTRHLMAAAIAIVASGLFAGSASAALYGDYTDPTGTVSFLNVQDVNGLYGAPSVSLNSLDFTPTQYEAQCSQCPGGATTTDTLTLDIQATAGQQISEIQVNEGLDYSLQSFDPAGFASATVIANLFIDVSEVNGVSINGLNSTVSVVFSPSNSASVVGFGQDSDVLLGTTGAIDIQQIILDAGGVGEATRVSISLDNTLQVFHDGSGGQALIRKRDADFVSLTINGGNPIPEPSTALLIGGGLALLARRRAIH